MTKRKNRSWKLIIALIYLTIITLSTLIGVCAGGTDDDDDDYLREFYRKAERISNVLGILLTYASRIHPVPSYVSNYETGTSPYTMDGYQLPVCDNEKCRKAANMLTSSMDTSVKPCVNFYKFACGKFPTSFQVTQNGPVRSWVENLKSYVDDRIFEHISKPICLDDPHVNRIRDMYQSCIDLDTMDRKKYEHFENFLESINVPIVPIFDNDGREVDWLLIAAKTVQTGLLEFLFTVDVSGHPNNRRLNTVHLRRARERPLVGDFDEESLAEVSQKKKSAFVKYVLGAIRLLADHRPDVNENDPPLLRDVERLYDFVQRKDELLNRPYTGGKLTIKTMELRAMQRKTNKITKDNSIKINWLNYINNVFAGIFDNPSQFEEEDNVVIHNWPYFQDAISLLSKTDNKIIVMAIWFDTLKMFSTSSTKELKHLYDTYREEIGTPPSLSRGRQCSRTIDLDFPLATSYMWMSDPDVYSKKNEVEAMTKSIINVFKWFIRRVNWMNTNSKNSAIDKINAMQTYIGFPRTFPYHGELSRQLSEFRDYGGDYIRSKLEFYRRLKRINLESLFKYNDKMGPKFYVSQTKVEAQYNPVKNDLIVPHAILHPPCYDYGIESLDYGALGVLISQQVTHGFDNTGKLYDRTGNNIAWMTKDTIKKFRDESQCFIDNYSNLEVPEINEKVNGILTLNENIADNGGISIAYEAYESLRNDRREYTLPGFETYTSGQLFTLGYAMTQCGYYPPWYLSNHVHSDERSPPEQRVNGMMMNFEKFETIWGCSEGDPMYPKKRCQIWDY